MVAPTSGLESSTDLSTDASSSFPGISDTKSASFEELVSTSFVLTVAVLVIVVPPVPASTVAVIVRVSV